MIRFFLFYILLLTIFLTGCDDFNKFYRQNRLSHKTIQNSYVARVGNRYITADDLKFALNDLPFNQRLLVESSASQFNNFINHYINRELLYNKAVQLGLDSREDIKFKSGAYEKNLLIKTLTEELFNHELNDDDLMDYYKRHIDKYLKARATVITVFKNDLSAKDLQNIIAGLKKFLTRSPAISDIEHYLNMQQGLKYRIRKHLDIPMNQVECTLTKTIYGLEPDQYSLPVDLKNSYSIYKLEKKPSPDEFVNVKNQIRSDLRNKLYREFLDGLKKTQGVEIYVSNYKEIKK